MRIRVITQLMIGAGTARERQTNQQRRSEYFQKENTYSKHHTLKISTIP